MMVQRHGVILDRVKALYTKISLLFIGLAQTLTSPCYKIHESLWIGPICILTLIHCPTTRILYKGHCMSLVLLHQLYSKE
jgi:hypothetical protein